MLENSLHISGMQPNDLSAPSLMHNKFRSRAPWWGGDLQTLRNEVRWRHVDYPSEARPIGLAVCDGTGDRLMGTLEKPLGCSANGPLVILIHGLTGCEDSRYIKESARFHLSRGRRTLRLNLRGAGRSRAMCAGFYHAGSASDIRDALNGLDPEDTKSGIVIVGFSLGGNILLNFLGRHQIPPELIGAVTVSAPIEPREACKRIMAPRNLIYHRFLLSRMKADVLTSNGLGTIERQIIKSAGSVFDLDENWVSKRNGYKDAHDYYEKTAGARLLSQIAVPTLLLHAENDPWVPAQPYLSAKTAPQVRIGLAKSGGHVGFHEKGYTETWHDRMIDGFLRSLGC